MKNGEKSKHTPSFFSSVVRESKPREISILLASPNLDGSSLCNNLNYFSFLFIHFSTYILYYYICNFFKLLNFFFVYKNVIRVREDKSSPLNFIAPYFHSILSPLCHIFWTDQKIETFSTHDWQRVALTLYFWRIARQWRFKKGKKNISEKKKKQQNEKSVCLGGGGGDFQYSGGTFRWVKWIRPSLLTDKFLVISSNFMITINCRSKIVKNYYILSFSIGYWSEVRCSQKRCSWHFVTKLLEHQNYHLNADNRNILIMKLFKKAKIIFNNTQNPTFQQFFKESNSFCLKLYQGYFPHSNVDF